MALQADRDDLVPMAFLCALIAAALFVAGWFVLDLLMAIIGRQPLGDSLFSSLAIVLAIVITATVIVLLTAFPLGIIYGRLILWRGCTTKGKAALAGALTGVTLIAIAVALGAEGFNDMVLLGSVLAGLGAISGLLAFHLVLGGNQEPQSDP